MAGRKSRRDRGMGDWGMEKKSYGIMKLKENTAVSGDDRGQCKKKGGRLTGKMGRDTSTHVNLYEIMSA